MPSSPMSSMSLISLSSFSSLSLSMSLEEPLSGLLGSSPSSDFILLCFVRLFWNHTFT